MSNNHNDKHRKKRGIKEYTLDKQYKVWVRLHLFRSFTDHLVMSYDDPRLAKYCSDVLETPPGLEFVQSYVTY